MRRAKRRKEEEGKKRLGIRWHIFLSLALFTVLIVLVQWMFQIELLSNFYEKEKFEEMQVLADKLEHYLGNEELDAVAESIAKEHDACVRVFLVKEQTATLVADAEIALDCVIHHMTPETLTSLYDSALENGGVFDKRFEFRRGDLEEKGGRPPFFRRGQYSVNDIHVRVLDLESGRFLMLLDCELTPVSATVNTLRVLFSWIALILLGAALLLAFVLSHIVAKPLIAITQKATKLAAGDYTADFPSDGYREVQELADALNFSAKEIGATDRLQRELIANISHDLRTPLTMIRGYGEMMRDIPGENSPENIQAVIDETTRLSALVSDLLDLSRLQAGMQKPRLAVFDFTALLRDTAKRYEALIRKEGYRIEYSLDEGLFVRADRAMLLQVIYNLINNAVNYAGKGKYIRVSAKAADGVVRFSVADDGEGIPRDQLANIWERYYRVDREHKRAVMGTGLGLSIVKSVLVAHDARYGVESAEGVGSVFWFELPLVENGDEDVHPL